jgi:(E)-4-hydroxy-3-methylbut-2-enyl-diphosphate synthase
VPDKKDTEALATHYRRLARADRGRRALPLRARLEAIEAGVHKIRLNPGNIQDRPKVERVIAACKERGMPIRVGVNEGGIVERKDKDARATEKALTGRLSPGNDRIMLAKLEEYLQIFDDNDFHDVVISAKSIDPRLVIDVYTAISQRWDYPLHLGVTHAGTPETGRIRSVRRPRHPAGQRHRRHDPHQLRR